MFESGAILQYPGRKSGCFYPQKSEAQRALVDNWHQRIAERPAIKKAMTIGVEEAKNIVPFYK